MSYPPQNQGYPPTNQGYPQQTPQYPGYNNPPPQGMPYQPSPQQYPPQQMYYQPAGQPQVGYGQQPVIQQTVTVQSQPVRFEHSPVHCQCPHCHAVVNSKVEREIGTTTFLHCLVFSIVCCCCCPFLMDCSKDASHYCPNCKKHLATFNQPCFDSGGGGGGSSGTRGNYGPDQNVTPYYDNLS